MHWQSQWHPARDTAADLAVEASTSGLGHFLAILDDVNDARKANAFAKARKVPVDKVVASIRNSGKFDTVVKSASEARALLKKAFPDAIELPPAVAGKPYPKPPAGVKKWFQLHPPESSKYGLDLPHFKYEDWTEGKKGSGGSLGHIFFLDPHN